MMTGSDPGRDMHQILSIDGMRNPAIGPVPQGMGLDYAGLRALTLMLATL